MKLYELAAEYENLLNAIDAGEIPEEAITDTLESITSLLEEKADNIGCIIKNLTAEAEAIKTEEVRLAERRRAKENQIERLKAYLAEVLTRGGYTKLETARNKMTFRKSESTVIDNETEFIAWAMENNDALLCATVNGNIIYTCTAAYNSSKLIAEIHCVEVC